MSHVIVFQGDSITDGNRTKDPAKFGDLNHYLGHGYAQMVAGRLTLDYPERGYVIHNRGITSRAVDQIAERWQEDVIDLRPDTVSLLAGANDIGQGKVPTHEAAYRGVLDRTKEALPNAEIVMVGPFMLSNGDENQTRKRRELDVVLEIQRRLAKEYGALFVPIQEKLEALLAVREREYWLWDGIHPTPAIHELIAREWVAHYLPWSDGKKA